MARQHVGEGAFPLVVRLAALGGVMDASEATR
jgi:hypothetical protein